MRIGADDPEMGARVAAEYGQPVVAPWPVRAAMAVGSAIGYLIVVSVLLALVAVSGWCTHLIWAVGSWGWGQWP